MPDVVPIGVQRGFVLEVEVPFGAAPLELDVQVVLDEGLRVLRVHRSEEASFNFGDGTPGDQFIVHFYIFRLANAHTHCAGNQLYASQVEDEATLTGEYTALICQFGREKRYANRLRSTLQFI